MDGEAAAHVKQLPPKFAALNISLPAVSAFVAKYNRATLPPFHILIEDLLSLTSQDVLPRERLPMFCAICSTLAAHPESFGGQVESVFFRVAAFMVRFVTSQKIEASAFCHSLCFICCNVLAHLSQNEGTFIEDSSQASLQLLLSFITDCMSDSHLTSPFFESFASKGFGYLLAFCEECTAHVLSVDIASEAGSSMLEHMWSVYLLVASIFVSSAAHDVETSHFQNFVCQVSNSMLITKDFLHLFRRPNDLACVAIKIASFASMRPQPNMASSFFVQCFDIIIRLRTFYLGRRQVDLLLTYLDFVSAVAEYSRCSSCASHAGGDVPHREGKALIEEALRTSAFDVDDILPASSFYGTDRVVAGWIAEELAFCSFVTEHFHEKILSKCSSTLELLRRADVLGFDQFQALWIKAVNCLCDGTNVLKTKGPEIAQCLSVVDRAFALKLVEGGAVAFALSTSTEIPVCNLKSLHMLAHYRDFQVMDAVMNALWDIIRCRCHSTANVDDVLDILLNACEKYCHAQFHLSHGTTLVPRLFSTLAHPDETIEAIFACQVLHIFVDSELCVSLSPSMFQSVLADSVKLFNSMCVQPIGPSSYSSSSLQEFFTWVLQLMLTLSVRQDATLSTELLSTCFQSLVSDRFLYDVALKCAIFSLLVQVCLHHDSIESALSDSATSRRLIDTVVIVLSHLVHLPVAAVCNSLQHINKSLDFFHRVLKEHIYLRCMQTSVMDSIWKFCFQHPNKNLLCFFADVLVVAADPRVSSLSNELHSGVSKLVASKLNDLSSSDEMTALLKIVKFAVLQRQSDCCFGALGLVSPPILIRVQKQEPVVFQMATSFRSVQSALGIDPCSMVVCNVDLDDAAALALSIGEVVKQTHEDTIPNLLNVSVESPLADSFESAPLLLLPQILGPKFLPWLQSIVFSDVQAIQNSALDVCCLLPSFDSSLATHLNPAMLDQFAKMISDEGVTDIDRNAIFFSCVYACSLMAAYTCNIGDLYAVSELSDSDVLFCSDLLKYCISQLDGKPSPVWNKIYLVGILSSLHCVSKCSRSQLPPTFCNILLSLQKLMSTAGFTAEASVFHSDANCPVGYLSLCRGIVNACVSVALNVVHKNSHPFFAQFLNVTLSDMPGSLVHAAYDSVAQSIQADRDRSVLDSIISACLAVPLVCRPSEFSRASKLFSKIVPFLSHHPEMLNSTIRNELLVSACRAIDSIDWSYCHTIRNGQNLISQFLHMCVLMLRIATENPPPDCAPFATSVVEIVATSFKGISCFVTADGGSCGLASFRGDASTLSQSARVSLSQMFSRIVDIFSHVVPVEVILCVLSKNHQMYNPDFDLDSSAQQREFQAWPGFTNLGNTCYMNAVLQQFLSAPWFSHVIMSAKCAPADDCLLYECQKMIANHFYSDLAVTCTRPLVDVSKIWGASIDSREPHDAQEYLMSLLDQIGADMQAEDKENLDGLFHGEISSHVTHGCKHGHTSVMKGSFVCLSLNIDGISSIHDCIQSTLQQEDISVDCAQCSSLKLEECHQASKKDFISACPPVLVIHLKRFLFDISSDSRVATVLKNVPSIPSLLDFSPFLSPDCPDLGLYDLHGMVLHVGSLEYGHYTSVFSHESPDSSKAREWLFADDHKVSVLPEDELQFLCEGEGEEKEGPLPYLIFYKKRNAHVFPKFKSSVFTTSPGKTPPPKASMHAAFAALPKGEDILRRIENLVLSGKTMVSEEPREISHLVASTVRHMKRSQASRFMHNAEYMELVCKLVRCFSDSHPRQAAELAISYLLHVLAPHARPNHVHSFKVSYQVIVQCFKSSEEFFACILSELTKAKALLSKFILGFRETFVEGLLFLQSVVAYSNVCQLKPAFNSFSDVLFNISLREIMQSNLPPVFLIHSLLRTSFVAPDGKLALLAIPLCKSILEACDAVDLSSDTNFNLLLDCGHLVINEHCIGAMSRLNKVDALRALIPDLLRIQTQASRFCAAASIVAFSDPIAHLLSNDLATAALEILDSSSFYPPQIVYQNTKAVLALSLKLWASNGQSLLAATFHQLLVLKSRTLPQNVFGVFAAFNQMTSDRRISQLLRDRAALVEDLIQWLLLTINLEDPEDSSDIFSISPFTSPVCERSGSATRRFCVDRVEYAATKLAASVRASLSFSDDEQSPEETQISPTFSETAAKL